jgi:hypothetical protein
MCVTGRIVSSYLRKEASRSAPNAVCCDVDAFLGHLSTSGLLQVTTSQDRIALVPECEPKSPRVYRHVAFDLETFDHLKEWQRVLEATSNQKLTNSEVLRSLVLAHRLP